MIWSDAFINLTDTINQTGATVLLGFNEPNNCYDNQACMTPAFAASLWPRLEVQRARGGEGADGGALTRGAQATGLRLGSPAVDAGPLAYLWLDQVRTWWSLLALFPAARPSSIDSHRLAVLRKLQQLQGGLRDRTLVQLLYVLHACPLC